MSIDPHRRGRSDRHTNPGPQRGDDRRDIADPVPPLPAEKEPGPSIKLPDGFPSIDGPEPDDKRQQPLWKAARALRDAENRVADARKVFRQRTADWNARKHEEETRRYHRATKSLQDVGVPADMLERLADLYRSNPAALTALTAQSGPPA